MPSSQQLLAAAVLLAVGTAAPAPVAPRAEPFTVNLIANPKYNATLPPVFQVYNMHAKYNKNGVPQHIQDAAKAAAAASGSVSATPSQYDSEYLSPVKIGSQTFNLDFDTGSSDLWVLGTGSSSAHTIYRPGSTATKSSGETWSISYGDGSSASGDVYTDTVNVGGTIVQGQSVERATTASSAFTSGPNDGLLGLGMDNINTCSPRQCTTFVTNAINNGLPLPVFTTTLKYHTAGSYDFGKIDSSKYSGSITYVNADGSRGYWGFTPSGYAVGSGSTRSSSSLAGIADTGTTLLYAPDAVVNAYYAQVSSAQYDSNQGGYTFSCSATLPNFSLIIGGYKATVPGKYINYAPTYDGSSTCFGGIQSSADVGINIYGDIFLKSQFVVFDKGSTRLGFAPQR